MSRVPPSPDRAAKCGCGTIKPSVDLANDSFFENLSPEAVAATPLERRSCGHCGYNEICHHPINRGTGRAGITDHVFVERTFEFDRFYCGCRGWD